MGKRREKRLLRTASAIAIEVPAMTGWVRGEQNLYIRMIFKAKIIFFRISVTFRIIYTFTHIDGQRNIFH